ncbi:MAG: hypothetical protein SV422_07825, partial [Pseudomonadota bacterium]|nr:hypothetical protein [Pseudomonadota bacterium]
AAATAPANTAAHDTALIAEGDGASVTSTLFLSITVSMIIPHTLTYAAADATASSCSAARLMPPP